MQNKINEIYLLTDKLEDKLYFINNLFKTMSCAIKYNEIENCDDYSLIEIAEVINNSFQDLIEIFDDLNTKVCDIKFNK